jgi:hypothetical protein
VSATDVRITDGFRKAFNARRAAFFPAGSQSFKLFEKKAGPVDPETESLLEITKDWWPTVERIRGQVEGLLRIEVLDPILDEDDQPLLTEEIARKGARILWQGTTYRVENYDAPRDAPRKWIFFCTEIKVGAVKNG